MSFLSKVRKGLEKIEDACSFLFKVVTSKKTLLVVLVSLFALRMKYFPIEIRTSDFLRFLDGNLIRSLTSLGNKTILFKDVQQTTYLCNYYVNDSNNFYHSLMRNKVDFNIYNDFSSLVLNPYNQIYGLSLAIGFILGDITKDIMQTAKARKYYLPSNLDIFADLVASESTLTTLKLIVDQLQNPKKYANSKIKGIKGALLYGKPGTGKTLIAKCLAKAKDITFISACASDFVEIYVGSGPKKVREIFDLARRSEPAILFIDELEAIGAQRSGNFQTYTNNIERYSTLNQLLSEMDGVYNNQNIVVIGATNREDLLDQALVRPGRFDYKINIDLPNVDERIKLFKLYLDKYLTKNIDDDLIIKLGKSTDSATGAIIENIVNEAATLCYSKNKEFVDREELESVCAKNIKEFLRFKKFEYQNSS